jgi:S-adenosylmethionine uptake transporter
MSWRRQGRRPSLIRLFVLKLSPAVRGASWMLAAAFSYSVAGALVRYISADISVFVLAFMRSVIALIMFSPMIVRYARLGHGALRTPQLPLHILRAALTYAAIVFWYFGVSHMPLSDYHALQFTLPLFTLAFTAIFLREKIGSTGWIAVSIGLVGALVIIRPGFTVFGIGAVFAIASTVSYGLVNVMVRVLTRTDSASLIVVYTNMLMLPLSIGPAIWFWTPPSLAQWPFVIGVGVFSTLGMTFLTRAIGTAATRVVQPFDFARLPFAAVLAFVFFGEVSDIWTWAGAMVIFFAGSFVLRRERKKPA